MTRQWIATLVLGSVSLLAQAQSMDKVKLDAYFDSLGKHNQFMGSVAILKEGQLLYSRSVGFADIISSKQANAQTEYRIGSISKTFTAVLVFKAIEAKKLRKDQTIAQWFPRIPNADKITVDMLLSHRSGIHNFTDMEHYQEWQTSAKTEQQLVDTIASAGSDFTPDSKGAYSNSNFVLLSYILERVTQKPYATLLQEQIIDPLGLKHTRYGGKINLNLNQANSYDYMGKWELHEQTDMSIPSGAGAIISTPSDLDAFITALFNGKLLSAESLEDMKTIREGYGRGLAQIPFGTKKAFGHGGSIDGFRSMVGYFPEDKVAFAMIANGKNYNTNDIAIAVLSAVFDKPYSIPGWSSFEPALADLESYTGVYSSSQFPLKLTISRQENVLIAQATGQSSFPLDAQARHKFRFVPAGVTMEFDPATKSLIMTQGGASFTFYKD
jgi:CubicO group peptidase (beta-lactamase class C family)